MSQPPHSISILAGVTKYGGSTTAHISGGQRNFYNGTTNTKTSAIATEPTIPLSNDHLSLITKPLSTISILENVTEYYGSATGYISGGQDNFYEGSTDTTSSAIAAERTIPQSNYGLSAKEGPTRGYPSIVRHSNPSN